MITVIVAGLAFIIAVAVTVGVVDALQAPTWRRIAAERRERWESRQLQLHGGPDPDNWDE
jgi:hypothetical protein